MSATLPTAPAPDQATLPQRKAMKLNQVIDVSRATAVVGDSLVYQTNGEWAPQDVTPGPGEVTDVMIGDRTITDTTVPTVNTGPLTTLLSNLGNMIKQITGKANWLTSPAITLEALNIHHARHSTGGADAIAPADIGASSTAHTHANATTSVAGFESTADKTKLDSVATNAAALATSGSPTTITTTSVTTADRGTGTTGAHADHVHGSPGLATAGIDGFMSSTFASKLNGIDANAAAVTSATPTAENVSSSGTVGTAALSARADHRHAMPGNATTSAAGFMSSTDKTKLDGLSNSIVGNGAFDVAASATQQLTTTPQTPTGCTYTATATGTYLLFGQADLNDLASIDAGVAFFTCQFYVNGSSTGIYANFAPSTLGSRVTVSCFGQYFINTGDTLTLRVSKNTGASSTSRSEAGSTKMTGFIIA
jgi:hypothetical protein